MMGPRSRGAEADQLFERALEVPEAERGAFLAKACRDDPELLHLVERLLRAVCEDDGALHTAAP